MKNLPRRSRPGERRLRWEVRVMDEKVRETLEKQLQLLSERSRETLPSDCDGLARLTEAMCALSEAICRPALQARQKKEFVPCDAATDSRNINQKCMC